jgi:hypothetical protein
VTAALLRDLPDFRRYWLGQALSAFGASVAGIALVLVALDVTGRPALAGAVGTVRLVVLMAARLPGGVLADRWSRRTVLIGGDVAKAVVWAVPALALAAGRCDLWLLLAVAALDGLLNAVYNPAAAAVFNRLAPAGDLPRALSLNEARSYAAGLVGPAIGGALFAASPALPLAANAVSYLCCAALIWRITTKLGGRVGSTGMVAEASEGLRFVAGRPFLVALAAWSALINFATAGAFFGLVPILRAAGSTATVIGVVSGLVSIGALCGALLAPRLAGRRPYPVVLATGGLAAALMATVALVPVPPVVAVGLSLLSAAGPVLVVIVNARVYALVPDALMGRVQSALLLAGSALYPFGSLAVGWLLQESGPALAYAAVAACLVGCVAICLTRSMRAELTAPADNPSPLVTARR